MILLGNSVSEGVAIAPAFVYVPEKPVVPESYLNVDDKESAILAVRGAFKAADDELGKLIESFSSDEQEQAAIFTAHREILRDEEFINSVIDRIEREAMAPEHAIFKCSNEFIATLSNVGDATIAMRAADIEDVRNRLLNCLRGGSRSVISNLSVDCILVARNLLPSDTAALDKTHVRGIVTETGGTTSHTAILARSFRIPALVGITGVLKQVSTGMHLILNARSGELVVEPTGEEIAAAEVARNVWYVGRAEEDAFLGRDAATNDGTRIMIGQNIGSDQDEISDYIDFIGLFRTEFLYMHSDHMPTEEEQLLAYTRVLQKAKKRMVTLRTLDIGGDKKLPYMELPKEENPFLGMRGLRLCLKQEEIFRIQLRAALRASVHGSLGILLPMVDGLDDIYRAKSIFESVKKELSRQNIPFCADVKLGIMIEIPATALIADHLAKVADFASIGSNDLCQYTHAVDRMNPEIASYYQSKSKAMFRLMEMAIRGFQAANKPVSICGELGGDPDAAEILIGLGIRKLSMNEASIAAVKRRLSEITIDEAKANAETIIS